MIRGGCSKDAIYLLQKLNFQCIIYQMKGIFLLYLLIQLNGKITHNFKNCMRKKGFLSYIFSIVLISTNNVLGSLKFCMHLNNIPLQETVSQFFFYLSVSFYFMTKNG